MPRLKPYDTLWYPRLAAVVQAMGETYASLELPASALQQKRKEFGRAHHKVSPNMRPLGVDIPSCRKFISTLEALATDVGRSETNPHVRDAYTARIHELIALNNLKTSAADGDAEKFATLNKELYGVPDAEIFSSICAWVIEDLQRLPADAFKKLPDVSQLDKLIPVSDSAANFCLPDAATFESVKLLHAKKGGYYDKLFGAQGLPADARVSETQGDPVILRMIRNIGSDYKIQTSANGLWSVEHNQKAVCIPATYNLEAKIFAGLVCHEIGSHLLESVNGTHQPLQLLRSGLNHYEAGNEGRAILREQIQFETASEHTRLPSWDIHGQALPSFEYRAALYLIIGLSAGVDGQPRGFNQIYKLATLLQALWQLKRDNFNLQACHDFAWHITCRALKGTNGHGGAYHKDIVYLQGNVRCWQAAAKNPEIILLGDLGKFDITNPKHIEILTGLGIISP